MTVRVLGGAETTADYQVDSVEIETEDATGETRTYQVSLTDDWVNGRRILAGKRTDDHEMNDGIPDGPTSAVYDAARARFRELGYEVTR